MDQIKLLREQLDQTPKAIPQTPAPVEPTEPSGGRNIRRLLDALSDSIAKSDIAFRSSGVYPTQRDIGGGRDVRVLFDALSDSIVKSEMYARTSRIFDTRGSTAQPPSTEQDGSEFRRLLDRMSSNAPSGHDFARIFTSQSQLPRSPDIVGDGHQISQAIAESTVNNDGVSNRIYIIPSDSEATRAGVRS